MSRFVTDKRQFSRLPVKFLLSYRTKKFVGDFFCVPEVFGHQEGFELTQRISRYSVVNILHHRTEKYREGFLLCCWACFLSEKFIKTRVEGGKRLDYNDFRSRICCLTGQKIFEGGFFCVPEFFGYPKVL